MAKTRIKTKKKSGTVISRKGKRRAAAERRTRSAAVRFLLTNFTGITEATMTPATWTETARLDALRLELARRERFPAWTEQVGLSAPQPVTVAELESELAEMATDDQHRDWCEWELALAREHYRLFPNAPFRRQVFCGEREEFR